VLPRFFGCSSRDAREVAAAIIPRQAPPTRDQVTRLAPSADQRVQFLTAVGEAHVAASPLAVAAALNLAPPVDSKSVRAHEPAPTHPARDAARDDVEPLTADLRRLHVTVSRQFLKKVEAARDGLSHSIPGASTEQVLEAALDLLLEKQARARGQVKRPRTALPTTSQTQTAPQLQTTPQTAPRTSQAASATGGPQQGSPADLVLTEPPPHRRTGPREAISASVRRAVWERDGGRCTWPIDGGGRCGSTHRLELDHVVPWARFSAPTVNNLRVVCRTHNALAARQTFGARCMERYAGARGDERGRARSG
jgi:hypothetical protein